MLPSNYGGGSREKIQRIIELASAAPQKMISNATFFNENRSTCHYLMPSMKMPVPHKAPNSPKRFTNLNLHCVSRTLAVPKMKIDFHTENKMLGI